MVCVPRHEGGAVTVVDPTGFRLKIPAWMLSPTSAACGVSAQGTLDAPTLSSLVDLLRAIASGKAATDLVARNVSSGDVDPGEEGSCGSTTSTRAGGRERRAARGVERRASGATRDPDGGCDRGDGRAGRKRR